MRRYWRCLCWALALSLGGTAAQAQQRVVIVSSVGSAAYATMAKSMVEVLASRGVVSSDIVQLGASQMAARLQSALSLQPLIFVAIGSEATQLLSSARLSVPVLSTLIPRRNFERILQSAGRVPGSQLNALYLDQPLRRQLALIHVALPQAKRVGVLLGPDSAFELPRLRSLAAAKGLTLRDAEIASSDALFAGLHRVLEDSDVLLAVADPLVLNTLTIQNILLTSFRGRIPMVAFSQAYVRAGAALALYSDPAQVGRQAAVYVLEVLRGNALPDHAIEPDDFEVEVNQHVARSLGLSLDAQALRLTLRRLENLP